MDRRRGRNEALRVGIFQTWRKPNSYCARSVFDAVWGTTFLCWIPQANGKSSSERLLMISTSSKNSYGINPAPDLERSTWHMAVAQRVQERWEARNSNHWCALCGKPNAEKRCSRCSQEYYCSDAHFAASWKRWHKRWCVPNASK